MSQLSPQITSTTTKMLTFLLLVATPMHLARADACFMLGTSAGQQTTCSCGQIGGTMLNSCTSQTAYRYDSYDYCKQTPPGMSGKTICNSRRAEIGASVTCSLQMDQSVYDAEQQCILIGIAASLALYYVCLASTSWTGFGIVGCIVAQQVGIAAAVFGCKASYETPNCYLYKCGVVQGSSETVYSSILVSFDGANCPPPNSGS